MTTFVAPSGLLPSGPNSQRGCPLDYYLITFRARKEGETPEPSGKPLMRKTPEILGFSRDFRGLKVVVGGGLEPPSLSAYAPQAYVSANFTIRPVEAAGIVALGRAGRKGVNRFFSSASISPSAIRR